MAHPACFLRSVLIGSLVTLALAWGGLAGCKDRSVGANTDATTPDGASPADAFVFPDAATPCGEPRHHMGIVWDTHVPAAEPEPGLLVY